MFGFFSRISKRIAQASSGVQSPAARHASRPRFLLPVIVPRSIVDEANEEPFEVVFAVEKFIHSMVSEGLYRKWEINPKAMQVSHADLYSAEVKNGGHSQFIHNAGEEFDAMVANARAALTAIGAKGQLAALEKMSTWVADHPDEAEEQTGFEGGRDDFLDTLDHAFYDADEASPMIELLARWIVSWPDLRVVEDETFDEAILQLAMANPRREPRLLHQSIAELVGQMISARNVGVSLACANATPPEVRLLLGMARMLDVDGEKQLVFQLRTNSNEPRLCVATGSHAAFYECIPPEAPAIIRPGENLFTAGAPRVGRRLGYADGQMVAKVIELAEEYHAPVAVDLLLRKIGVDPTKAIVSANSVVQRAEGPVVNWVVMAGGHAFLFQSYPDRGVLLRGDHEESLAEVHRNELQEYFDLTAAAGE
ncbi:DUF4375 domain-containing protein [bacterium M00.F.Ca.ET.141.01.1.1]|nr:DUF4375 domain-containing protein [Mesorhizobium sp. M8A.F.Ca.ET.059.01.1.1]RUW99319.1 DUF4375 domain-containing protein [Mesorhizobium sp. M8A.F.Ca.ET.023.01.1.1]RWC65775.1 MAG: DUF4375 domain-containing protein [Mesorhizobium sp.]TGQ95746.1 DUF4375 domain-containing protein [Mesorhizobium sp. M8A.F.Ca.ET.208.01.1.1]TGT43831.1 DUF4375 domain-containing protein [Mesorhizobium sp. M8A.F.Ca.ET.165.01.1.1]TGT56236.1 DUF4375 domain-containing protein [Mesorhizobium sp. M8A.F.Ca.ET.167.01.1.1]T